MRKNLLLGALIATMLFSSACTKESMNNVQPADQTNVSFSLNLDDSMVTRATEDVVADKLVYSIFDENGNLLDGTNSMNVVENAFANGAENISVSLVKGMTYNIVFWAQNSACKAYTVKAEADGLKVDVDYNGANNDETRDAFFASQKFTVEDGAEFGVVLERPFAQINLGVTQEDWNAAISSGINVTKSKVVIKNAATSINLLDGSVSGESVVSYDFAEIPSVSTKATSTVKTLEVDEVSYKWLSMSYILTSDSKSTLDSDGLQFVLNTAEGENIVLEEGLHNVPVQRNWRTNVVGNVLTGAVSFNVTVDQKYNYTANVSTLEQFKAALEDSHVKVINLAAGVYDLVYVLDRSCTIQSADPANPATISGILAVASPAKNVVFNNLKFDVSDNSVLTTGHQYIDRYERKAIVPVYAAQVSFSGCEFVNLYDERCVVAINYNAHIPGVMLNVDNCSFSGYAYAIYTRSLVSVTNSTFNQVHNNVYPRAIFLYGLGDGTQGNVIFKNNKAVGKTSYAIQILSKTQPYGNILFDVQGNTNFDVNGEAYLVTASLDLSGATFAEGSMTF